jgi:hypothetical protein
LNDAFLLLTGIAVHQRVLITMFGPNPGEAALGVNAMIAPAGAYV